MSTPLDRSRTPVGLDHSSLHHVIVEYVVEHGVAPEPAQLAERFQVSLADLEAALRGLQDDHGVLLHPGSARIRAIHPFSGAPTDFLVTAGPDRWWAPCAWCALGVAAVVGRDVDIVTTIGATPDEVTLAVRGGELSDTGFCVHFPVPMRRAWDDVAYTCSTMLLFRGETDVERWCARHGVAKGDVRSVALVWELAQVWYGNHRAPDWRKWSVSEAREIFAGFGLEGDIWELPHTDGTF